MTADTDADDVAAALRLAIGLVVRKLRQVQVPGELTLPESSALARLDRGGPANASDLARLEQISPQSMGATLAALEARGLVTRRSDPADGRRVVLSPTPEGLRVLHDRRNARTEEIAAALRSAFTEDEIAALAAAAPLLERLAEAL
jgi:DNA-binding MarR family transcriptional regulator